MIIIPLTISSLILDYWVGMIVDLITYSVVFGWFLLVGTNLNEQLPPKERSSDAFFIINCFYLIVCASLFSILGEMNKEAEIPFYVLLLAIYFTFAFFYVVYFNSKAFLAVQDKASNGYKAEIVFIAFFIFIAGVWLLQPKIRKLFSN